MPASSFSQNPSDSGAIDPLSVLILDDERFDRHRMARLCSGLPMDCQITNALTLEGFGPLVEKSVFHLILLDYSLPDGTGLQALDAVRCSSHNYDSTIIMVTGQNDTTVAEAALRGGCAEYMTKDELTAEKFHRAVLSALGRATLSLRLEAQNFARDEVEKLLEVLSAQFSGEIKPLVSRSLRLLRVMRSDPIPERISALEESCLDMWEALIRQERHKGSSLLAQALPRQENEPHARGRKPPSPFARMRH